MLNGVYRNARRNRHGAAPRSTESAAISTRRPLIPTRENAMSAMPNACLLRHAFRALLFATTLFTVVPGGAAIVSNGCAGGPTATSCTLGELYGGASVFVDEMRFYDWQFVASDDALSSVNPDSVVVAFSENGRRVNVDIITSSFHPDANGTEGNYAFAFRVQPKTGEPLDRIDKYSLDLVTYQLGGTGSAAGRVQSCLDAADLDPLCGPDALVSAERFNGISTETTHAETRFDPKTALLVLNAISVAGSPGTAQDDPPGASASIGQFRQSFYRIPEPPMLALTGVVLVACMALRTQRRPRASLAG